MEIVSETVEQFYSVRSGTQLKPETRAVLEMEVDSVIRISDHEHVTHKSNRAACNVSMAINITAKARGMKVSCRHDGPDLLVMRIK